MLLPPDRRLAREIVAAPVRDPADSCLFKSFATFAPIVPCISTADESGSERPVGGFCDDASAPQLQHRRHGARVPELVSGATVMTMNSCDLIACGTITRDGFLQDGERSHRIQNTARGLAGRDPLKRTGERAYMGPTLPTRMRSKRHRPRAARRDGSDLSIALGLAQHTLPRHHRACPGDPDRLAIRLLLRLMAWTSRQRTIARSHQRVDAGLRPCSSRRLHPARDRAAHSPCGRSAAAGTHARRQRENPAAPDAVLEDLPSLLGSAGSAPCPSRRPRSRRRRRAVPQQRRAAVMTMAMVTPFVLLASAIRGHNL